jgi:hypothetical protein
VSSFNGREFSGCDSGGPRARAGLAPYWTMQGIGIPCSVCPPWESSTSRFQYMTHPPLDDVQTRHEYRRRLNGIPGVSIPEDAITRRPSIPLALFAANPKALEAFKAALDWFCETGAIARRRSRRRLAPT